MSHTIIPTLRPNHSPFLAVPPFLPTLLLKLLLKVFLLLNFIIRLLNNEVVATPRSSDFGSLMVGAQPAGWKARL